jgi:hypothetical protein
MTEGGSGPGSPPHASIRGKARRSGPQTNCLFTSYCNKPPAKRVRKIWRRAWKITIIAKAKEIWQSPTNDDKEKYIATFADLFSNQIRQAPSDSGVIRISRCSGSSCEIPGSWGCGYLHNWLHRHRSTVHGRPDGQALPRTRNWVGGHGAIRIPKGILFLPHDGFDTRIQTRAASSEYYV